MTTDLTALLAGLAAKPENWRLEYFRREILPVLHSVDPLERDATIKQAHGHLKALGVRLASLHNMVELTAPPALDDDKHPKAEAREIPTAIFPGLVDIVEHDGAPAFLLLQDGKLGITTAIPEEEGILVPPDQDKTPWLLPRATEVLKYYTQDNDEAVYDTLLDYFKGVSELPTHKHYDLLATWTMHTYLIEKHQYSPYLWFYAIYERGKTRTGKALIYVAYHGVHVESLRDAYIVRVANDWRATIFFDVIDLWQKAEKVGSEDVLMSRFERGIRVPRVNYPDRGKHRDVVYYDIFGATIAATNKQVGDGLQTRAIQINMPESARNFDSEVKAELSLPLKERLTAFRARHLDTELPAMAKPPFRRLGDITRPLLQVARLVRPEREAVLRELIGEIENEKRMALSSTLDARIIDILLTLDPEKPTWFENVECFLLTDLEELINAGVAEKQQVTSKYLGGKLRALGFPFVHRQAITKRRLYRYDRGLLDRLAVRYGLVDPPKRESDTQAGTPSENGSRWFRRSQSVGAVRPESGTIDTEGGTIEATVPDGPGNGPGGSPCESKDRDQRDHWDRKSGGTYTQNSLSPDDGYTAFSQAVDEVVAHADLSGYREDIL
jgi:hypothetical protein